eukprot:2098828-Rhodomonas_salina.1
MLYHRRAPLAHTSIVIATLAILLHERHSKDFFLCSVTAPSGPRPADSAHIPIFLSSLLVLSIPPLIALSSSLLLRCLSKPYSRATSSHGMYLLGHRGKWPGSYFVFNSWNQTSFRQ